MIEFLQDLVEPVPVLGQQLGLEPVRHAVEGPRVGIALVPAHDHPADLGAVVDQVVGVAQRRQRLQRRVERLGHEELVRVGDDRHVHPHQPRDLGRVHAAGAHHDVGADCALVSDDLVHAAVAQRDVEHLGALLDLGAAQARPVGERKRELAGVEVAIVGQESRREHPVGRHQREHRLRLLSRDDLDRQAEALGPARLALNLLVAGLGRRQPQAAELVPARILARLLGKLGVQPHRVLHHLGQADGRAQLADKAGGVPGRAVRQPVLLDEDDVVPPHLRQVVEDAAPAHTPADDDRSCLTAHAHSTLRPLV